MTLFFQMTTFVIGAIFRKRQFPCRSSTYADLGVVEEAMVVGTTKEVLRRILLLVVLGLTMGHRIVSSCIVLRLHNLVRLMGRLLI